MKPKWCHFLKCKNGQCKCIHCGRIAETDSWCYRLRYECGDPDSKAHVPKKPELPEGAGTELHKVIEQFGRLFNAVSPVKLNFSITPTCACMRMIKKMNQMGCDWCELPENNRAIIGQLRDEGKKRINDAAAGSTLLSAFEKIGIKVGRRPPGAICQRLVDKAIARARRKCSGSSE